MLTTITVPRPTVAYAPKHLSGDEADVVYLREAAKTIAEGRTFGSNLSATVAKLLNDAAAAIESSAEQGTAIGTTTRSLTHPEQEHCGEVDPDEGACIYPLGHVDEHFYSMFGTPRA
jgi:hypothetical protein